MKVDSRTTERADLQSKVLPELQQIAEGLGVEGHQRLRKSDLIDAIVEKSSTDGHGTTAPETDSEASSVDANGESRGARGDGSRSRGRGSSTTSQDEREASTAVAERAAPEDRQAASGTQTVTEERPSSERRDRRPSREDRRRDRERRREREREERE